MSHLRTEWEDTVNSHSFPLQLFRSVCEVSIVGSTVAKAANTVAAALPIIEFHSKEEDGNVAVDLDIYLILIRAVICRKP